MYVQTQASVYSFEHINNKMKQWIQSIDKDLKQWHSKHMIHVKGNETYNVQDTWET